MSNSKSVVYIQDRESGEYVEATICSEITGAHLKAYESEWMPELLGGLKRLAERGVPRDKWPQHSRWDWREKVRQISSLLAYETHVLECSGSLEGLLCLNTTTYYGRLDEQRNKPLVYIEFLEVAPWNLPDLSLKPRYRLVGSVLIAVAITRSLELGFSGRIGLNSLPQSESFYLNGCGMTEVEKDAHKQNLMYYEMTHDQAFDFLEAD